MDGVFVYVGNGAVGTTTCAGATGIALADRGTETVVVSFDPMGSLSDAFGTTIGPEPTPLREGLTGVEISPEAGQETYTELFDAIADTVSSVGIDLADGHVGDFVRDERIPLGREIAALEAVASFVRDPHYDAVVFDTGPRGKILRLLRAPGMVGIGVSVAQDVTNQLERVARETTERITEPLPWNTRGSGSPHGGEDRQGPSAEETRGTAGGSADAHEGGRATPVDEELPAKADEEIERRVQTVRTTLSGAGRRQLRVVTTPEDVAVRYLDHMVANVTNAGIPAGPLFVNQVLEDYDEGCARCRAQHRRHREILDELREELEELELCVLPDYRGEADGEAMLERLAPRIPLSAADG